MGTKLYLYILIAVFLAGSGAYAGYHYTDKYWNAKYDNKINQINQDSANRMILAESAKVAAEQKQKDAVEAAQRTYNETITNLIGTVAQLRAEHVVLHDPGRRQVHHTTRLALASGASSSVISSSGGTAISSGATDFLLSFAQRADTVRASLLECQADDASVRNAVSQYNNSLKSIQNESSKQVKKSVDANLK